MRDEIEVLFRTEYPRLIRALSLACGDADRASDAVQEAFLQASKHWRKIRHYDDPGAWLRRDPERCPAPGLQHEAYDFDTAEVDPGLATASAPMSASIGITTRTARPGPSVSPVTAPYWRSEPMRESPAPVPVRVDELAKIPGVAWSARPPWYGMWVVAFASHTLDDEPVYGVLAIPVDGGTVGSQTQPRGQTWPVVFDGLPDHG